MKEIIQLTKELIKFRTLQSRPEEIQRCAAFIEEYLKKCAARYRRLDYNDSPSIIVLPPSGFAPILLMSHIDVVDAPEELFRPREENGKLYGRGSIDDKYAVALSLVLLRQFQQRMKKQKNHPHELKLIASGKTAHGARPWLGENAIENLINDYQVLKTHFDLSAKDHWHRTLNFSRIQAGKASNQVPDYAEALFDIRYTENDDMEKVLQKIQAEIKGQLLVEKKEPLFEGGDSPYLDLLLEIAENIDVGFEHGASDARFLSAYGIKGIVWGADGDMSQHSDDEHVDVESVFKLYDLLAEFIQRSQALRPHT